MNTITAPEILTVAEVADYLQISRVTLYKLLKNHQLPAFRLGSDWRFRRAAIETWITEQSKTPQER